MFAAQVGQPAPPFALTCTDLSRQDWRTSLADYAGGWLMMIFYPRDFSFVCPTELTAFSARIGDFRRRNCQVLGISVDRIDLHQEWLRTPPDLGGLGPLQFPLGSDSEGVVARSFGVWDAAQKICTRGLFVIDPQGLLQYAVVHNVNVGRSADEVLRVLDALQTGGVCPAGWTRADGTLNLEQLLQPGRVLNHYRLRRLLGQGTFGTVFAAWDLHLERMVALKVFFKSNPESRALLLSEARAAARLNHPNVCTMYAVEELEGLPVIVMEHLDGQPLSELISPAMAPEAVRRLAAQIAQALAAAHNISLVHGDLKPANIMVTGDGMPKILDFGLARLHSNRAEEVCRSCAEDAPAEEIDAIDLDGTLVRAADPCLTYRAASAAAIQLDTTVAPRPRAPGLTGTPAYMAPEQAEARPTSPASDTFSFGLLLYELLTGRRALPEIALLPLLQRLRSEDFATTLTGQVDGPYREILGRMLARDPVRRPSMADLAEFFSAPIV
jgi:alkyl hydroperoxide reductase subunit AhpC